MLLHYAATLCSYTMQLDYAAEEAAKKRKCGDPRVYFSPFFLFLHFLLCPVMVGGASTTAVFL